MDRETVPVSDWRKSPSQSHLKSKCHQKRHTFPFGSFPLFQLATEPTLFPHFNVFMFSFDLFRFCFLSICFVSLSQSKTDWIVKERRKRRNSWIPLLWFSRLNSHWSLFFSFIGGEEWMGKRIKVADKWFFFNATAFWIFVTGPILPPPISYK